MRFYVAGPLRAASDAEHFRNCERAAVLAIRLWRKGHHVFCPHSNSGKYVNMLRNDVPDSAFLEFGLYMLSCMDGLVLVEGWQESEGALAEVAEAKRLGLPVYVGAEGVPHE